MKAHHPIPGPYSAQINLAFE